MKCTFFGHKNTPDNVKHILRELIIDMIEKHNVDTFYVGNNGNFDAMASNILKNIAPYYPNVKYYIVLAYLPTVKKEFDITEYENTIYPEGLEKTPKRFAIDKRNRWMVDNSAIAITYVSSTIGGAYKFKTLAEKKNKKVINIFDILKETSP